MAGASHILTTSWSMIESNKKLMPRRGAANTPMRAIEVLRGLPFRASDFEVGRDRALPKACAGARRCCTIRSSGAKRASAECVQWSPSTRRGVRIAHEPRKLARIEFSRADWIASCLQRYRSFDPETGTYLGYGGNRQNCR
jgi:hypothetical protein